MPLSMSISPIMIKKLYDRIKGKYPDIECIVAPYEADS